MFGSGCVAATETRETTETAAARRALDALLGADLVAASGQPALDTIREIEGLTRRLRAVQIRLQAGLEEVDAASDDAFASAKAMVRHGAKLAPVSAAGRDRGLRMARDLPELFTALADGLLGVDQYDLLGRVHANPRVRPAMADAQRWFLERASSGAFKEFEAEVRQWERLADADGPEPKDSINHDNRNVSLRQDPIDLGWDLRGSFGALQGAALHEILERYVEAERLADWEKARAENGDAATAADLPRIESQRRADALWQLFQDAARAQGSSLPIDFVHGIVWDHATYEEMLRRLAGDLPRPLDPMTARCETLDGIPLEPTEAAANSLVHMFRRVVVDAAGVVIDLGRARRYTGSARSAAQLSATHCPWPGCSVPSSRCEIDHGVDHSKGGRTNPGNGAPFCGKHNRWKQKGFAVWRDPVGVWHTYRPDGTEIL